MKCVRTQMLCEGPYKECVEWKERKCVQHQQKCHDRRYKIKGKNQYCANCGHHGYSYNWCRWYDGLEGGETVGAIFTLGLSLLGDHDWEYCYPGTSKCFGYHRPHWAPCEQYSRPECTRKEERCRSRPNVCVDWEDYCAEWEDVCTKWRVEEHCNATRPFCLEYEPEGDFCQDQGQQSHGKSCQKCSVCEILQTLLKRIFKFSDKLQDQANDENSNTDIDNIILDNLLEIRNISETIKSLNDTDEIELESFSEELQALKIVLDKLLRSMNYFLERDIRRVVLSTENSVDISDLSRLTNKTLLHSKQVRQKKLKTTKVFLNEYLRTSSFKSTECEVQRSCDDISECFHYDYYYGGPKSCARSKHFTKCSAVCNNVEKNHTFAEQVFTENAEELVHMLVR